MKPLTEEQVKKNQERFENILKSIKKDGMTKLMDYLSKKDFYTAPAGVSGTLACSGGLLQHSLNVYDRLMKKTQSDFWKECLGNISTETVMIVSLLANICYVSYYDPVYQDGKIAGYCVNDKNPYGLGEKSVWIMNTFMKLNSMEAYAIRWFLEDDSKEAFPKAVQMQPLVLAMREAEKEARFIIEARE